MIVTTEVRITAPFSLSSVLKVQRRPLELIEHKHFFCRVEGRVIIIENINLGRSLKQYKDRP